jgi:hypothetical protein
MDESDARFYGTFPRKLRLYGMERGALSAEGFDLVLVNGVPVAEQGKPTWKLPGTLLTQ